MQVTAVQAAVTRISAATRTLPPKLYRRVNGSKEVASDHPAHRLIHRYANDWTSAGELRKLLTQDALLHGNGYAIANRPNGAVVEFLRVDPGAMSVVANDYGEPIYRLATTGGVVAYTHRDVLHLRAPTSFDGLTAKAPIALAREGIALALLMETHGAKLFANGARPSMAIEYPAEASKTGPNQSAADARKSLITAARAGFEGSDKSGRLAVLFDGATAKPFTFSSVDAQFLELRRFTIEEIARAFSVPPHMLFEMGRATWGNSEEMGRQFLQHTLLAWLEEWTDAYSRVLLDPETDDDLSIEWIVDDFLRADTATRFEAYSKAIASRILSPNEVRAMENRSPYVGGDEFQNPNTMTSGQPPKEAA